MWTNRPSHSLIAHKSQIGCERIDFTGAPQTLRLEILVRQRTFVLGHAQVGQHLKQRSRMGKVEGGIGAWLQCAARQENCIAIKIQNSGESSTRNYTRSNIFPFHSSFTLEGEFAKCRDVFVGALQFSLILFLQD